MNIFMLVWVCKNKNMWVSIKNKINFSDWRRKHAEKWTMLMTFFLTAIAAITGKRYKLMLMKIVSLLCIALCLTLFSFLISFFLYHRGRVLALPLSRDCFNQRIDFFSSTTPHFAGKNGYIPGTFTICISVGQLWFLSHAYRQADRLTNWYRVVQITTPVHWLLSQYCWKHRFYAEVLEWLSSIKHRIN